MLRWRLTPRKAGAGCAWRAGIPGVGRVAGDHRDRDFGGDSPAKGNGVLGSTGRDEFDGQFLDQRVGLRAAAALATGQEEADRSTAAGHGQVNPGAQAATGATKGLIFRPAFSAPTAW